MRPDDETFVTPTEETSTPARVVSPAAVFDEMLKLGRADATNALTVIEIVCAASLELMTPSRPRSFHTVSTYVPATVGRKDILLIPTVADDVTVDAVVAVATAEMLVPIGPTFEKVAVVEPAIEVGVAAAAAVTATAPPAGYEVNTPLRVTFMAAVSTTVVAPTCTATAALITGVVVTLVKLIAVTVPSAFSVALAGATDVKTPKPREATATSATRLKVVFVDICFLSISRDQEFPALGFG
jgi:hypothetical protein